jgi:hypothetical protein
VSDHDDHIGQGHESEPYVNLLRGISPEVHDHTVRIEKSKSFDQGFLAGIEWSQTESKELVRVAAQVARDEVHEDYAALDLARRKDNRLFLLVLVTFCMAAYLMVRVG